MPFAKGNKFGNRFNSEKQPLNPGRPPGIKTRATVARMVLDLQVRTPKELQEKFVEMLPNLPKKMSIEELATLSVISQAVKDGDYLKYKAIVDSAYGAPKQEVEHSGEVEIGFDIGKISDSDLNTILQITQKARNGD